MTQLRYCFMIGFLAVIAPGFASKPHESAQHISWETSGGPFCGRCDTTKIIASYDGRVWIEQGHWAGNYRDWRTKRREVRVSPEAIARYRERLAAYRPKGDRDMREPEQCEKFIHHSTEIGIEWVDARGHDRFWFFFGCDFEKNAEMGKAIETAPALLEIPDLSMPELE